MTIALSDPNDRRPLLIIVVGRQRVGKTSFLNTTVQYVRSTGGDLVVWNADKLNTSYSLSMFHADALEPESADIEDVKRWLEGRFMHLAQHGYDAVLDVGGASTPLARLVEEAPIVRTLEEFGVRVVLIHVVGPEVADLDYLERFQAEALFAPEATVIVLNGGLVLTGRSINSAFENVRRHPVITAAMLSGARVLTFPKLACMSEVTDRHLSFADAMKRVERPGIEPLAFFDPPRVDIWWKRDLPAFFGSFPPLWLPEMPSLMQPPPVAAAPPPSRPRAAAKQGGTDA